MNRLVRKNSHQTMDTFDIGVANQIWDECQKDHNGMVMIGDYAQVLLQAKNIMETKLNETSGIFKIIQKNLFI